MSKVLFNIDDLALILVISSSLIFITILLSDSKSGQNKYWLSAFLGCIAVASANAILYWSPIIRTELTAFQPHTYLIAQVALLSSAPTLYIYTKSLIYKDYSCSKKDVLHFSPTLAYLALIPFIYMTMGHKSIEDSAIHYNLLYENTIFWAVTWAQHLIKLGYGLATLRALVNHKSNLKNTSSDTESVDGNWLLIMVVGFIVYWFIQAISQISHEVHTIAVANFIALFGNYFLFALVNLLVILSLTRSTATAAKEPKNQDQNQAHEYTDEQVTRLERTIKERQPYLKSDLTLEELSKVTSIPQRTLSAIINRHHQKNFFEYVNEHRVNRAAELLIGTDSKLSILDIMEESGFNSKSAFNRFFKKSKGMTPTQYKAQQS